MYETEEDLRRLQHLLDRTLVNPNPRLTSIVASQRGLTAREVVCHLEGTSTSRLPRQRAW